LRMFRPDGEVVGVVERGLGTKGALELEVLLDTAVFVVEAKARLDTVSDDAGPGSALACAW
jgi:hypothetical protein